MRPLRVLQIVYALETGGIEGWLDALVSPMARRGVSMDFLVFKRGAVLEKGMAGRGVRILVARRAPESLLFGPTISRLMKKNGPYDIAHCHFAARQMPLLWARHAGIRRRIFHLHRQFTRWPVPPPLERLWTAVRPEERRRQGATHIFAAGRTVARSWYPDGVEGAALGVVPCGIEANRFDRAVDRRELRRSLGIDPSAWVIGHVGRLAEIKNQTFLLDVFANLRRRDERARLLLIGDGEDLARLEREAEEKGIAGSVVFAGRRSDVPDLLSGVIDHFVFPSRSEGLPLAVIEAQAAGLPVLLPDHITNEIDVVPALLRRMPAGAPSEAWADAIVDQFRMPRPSAAEARQAVKRSGFTLEKSADRLAEAYRRAVPA